LGWEPAAFSEIEPFPVAVLKHHWPEVQNLGDMTKYEQWNIGTIDLLVGGTPCQSFSVAGLRQGLKDPRGNLMLTYLAIAERLKPRWLVWENVPGVLSSNGGKDFGSFLGALGELGYVDWAYRVLDAQWFGVAQRRRRVFVVAHLGEGSLAAKVLFESESVRRDNAPSREARQGVATNVEAGVGVSLPEREVVGCLSDGAHMGGGLTDRTPTLAESWPSRIAKTLMATDHKGPGHNRDHNFVVGAIDCRISAQRAQNAAAGHYIAVAIPIHDQATRHAGKHGDKQDGKGNGLGVGKVGDPCPTLTKGDKHAVLYENHPNDSRVTGPHDVAPSCVSRYGTGGGNVPLVQEVIPFDTTQITSKANYSKPKAGDPCHPIAAGAHPPAIAFEPGIATREGKEGRFVKELSPTLRKQMGDNQVAVAFPIDTQNMTEGHASGGKGHGNNGDPSFTITKGHSHAVAVDIYNQAVGVKSQTLRSGASSIEHSGGVINPADRMAVRRLTPRECERLQGFDDDHTMIPWRNKPADQCPDGPRYKALGNSMAVPCMAWIGKRIANVEESL
jgi:DNA (cytosine-5)-methyltransferase 1